MRQSKLTPRGLSLLRALGVPAPLLTRGALPKLFVTNGEKFERATVIFREDGPFRLQGAMPPRKTLQTALGRVVPAPLHCCCRTIRGQQKGRFDAPEDRVEKAGFLFLSILQKIADR